MEAISNKALSAAHKMLGHVDPADDRPRPTPPKRVNISMRWLRKAHSRERKFGNAMGFKDWARSLRGNGAGVLLGTADPSLRSNPTAKVAALLGVQPGALALRNLEKAQKARDAKRSGRGRYKGPKVEAPPKKDKKEKKDKDKD